MRACRCDRHRRRHMQVVHCRRRRWLARRGWVARVVYRSTTALPGLAGLTRMPPLDRPLLPRTQPRRRMRMVWMVRVRMVLARLWRVGVVVGARPVRVEMMCMCVLLRVRRPIHCVRWRLRSSGRTRTCSRVWPTGSTRERQRVEERRARGARGRMGCRRGREGAFLRWASATCWVC